MFNKDMVAEGFATMLSLYSTSQSSNKKSIVSLKALCLSTLKIARKVKRAKIVL
jgi:hypothetical protein